MCKCTCENSEATKENGQRVGPEIQGNDLLPENGITSSAALQAD